MPGLPDVNSLDPYLVVGIAVALVLVQTALVIGFLVPGGKAAVLTGVLAGLGHVPVLAALAGIVGAAILGAAVGYLLGRRYGDRIFEHRWLTGQRPRIDAARDLLRQRAGFALMAGRSVAVLRATSPALAGASGVPARQFLLWNVAGALVWGSAMVGLGYLGGSSLAGVVGDLPPAVLAGLVVALLLGSLLAVRRRAGRRGASGPDRAAPAGTSATS
ncbi:DedA family protein [Nocardioides marmoriginsengisoli]|uniref:DedA family protein n=1 Tax=Nocardioides marmoriginsengisoli TaxID=661483 RepID=UPI00161A4B53|nr:DedA family protein [Nocardioides marmoriginsengisoli]